MSLVTPEKIRTLQRKLYHKAKAEPAFRFYVLYEKICREDTLRHAYGLARGNAGAPGVDGMSFGQIEAAGLEVWLAGLREELVSKTYRPDPVRRVMIPKPDGGGERALGIPTIRDRVAQTAELVLEPIFEADFEDNAYGYRPAGGAVDAVKKVHRLICRGDTDVVDADLSRYFDSIPHNELLKSVARRVADGSVLRLIKLWLKAPIEERDADGTRRMSGGKGNTRGTPQGGVASPLLANIYMNRFLKYWRLTERGEAFRAESTIGASPGGVSAQVSNSLPTTSTGTATAPGSASKMVSPEAPVRRVTEEVRTAPETFEPRCAAPLTAAVVPALVPISQTGNAARERPKSIARLIASAEAGRWRWPVSEVPLGASGSTTANPCATH